jgi:hypothetical protein
MKKNSKQTRKAMTDLTIGIDLGDKYSTTVCWTNPGNWWRAGRC